MNLYAVKVLGQVVETRPAAAQMSADGDREALQLLRTQLTCAYELTWGPALMLITAAGQAANERGEGVTPDSSFLARRHLAAQFYSCEPLAERMKLARSVPYRTTAEQSGHLDPGRVRLEAGESLRAGISEIPR